VHHTWGRKWSLEKIYLKTKQRGEKKGTRTCTITQLQIREPWEHWEKKNPKTFSKTISQETQETQGGVIMDSSTKFQGEARDVSVKGKAEACGVARRRKTRIQGLASDRKKSGKNEQTPSPRVSGKRIETIKAPEKGGEEEKFPAESNNTIAEWSTGETKIFDHETTAPGSTNKLEDWWSKKDEIKKMSQEKNRKFSAGGKQEGPKRLKPFKQDGAVHCAYDRATANRGKKRDLSLIRVGKEHKHFCTGLQEGG